jgi:hypothetical protein
MKTCPDCGGNLEEGALIDFTYGQVVAQRYGKANLPKNKKFHEYTNSIETDFTDTRRVQALRCQKCNRIFLYAQDIVLDKNIKRGVNTLLLTTAIVVMISAVFILAAMVIGLIQ